MAELHRRRSSGSRAAQMLTPAERRRVLTGRDDTAREVPAATLPELFEAQAARTPHAPAVVFEGSRVSYAELNEQANRLARHLIDRGARPGALVAVALERSADLVAVMLGVLKSGAAYLPVDLAYPAERIGFMLADARPAMLVCDAATAGSIPDAGISPVVIDDPVTAAALAALPGSSPGDKDRAGPLLPAHPAYVIYTSGSTGVPKGVVVEHRNVARLLAMTWDWFELGPDAVWTLFHSYAFDFSVWEIRPGRPLPARRRARRPPDGRARSQDQPEDLHEQPNGQGSRQIPGSLILESATAISFRKGPR